MHLYSRKVILQLLIFVVMCGGINCGWAQLITLTVQKLQPVSVKMEEVLYKGKKAVRVMPINDYAETIAILKN